MIFLTTFLLFSCLGSLTETNSADLPRMTFTDRETTMKRLPIPGDNVPVQILLGGEPDTVTAAAQKHLITFNFRNPLKKPVEKMLLWEECKGSRLPSTECNYNITVVHKRKEANKVFVCGTDGRETMCCDMDLSQQSPMCVSSENMNSIKGSIREFAIKEGEPSILEESGLGADLYITNSGSHQYVGIHKFGRNRVGPANQNKEQHYVGLVLSRRKDDHLQDKVYAFYNERNKDTGLHSDMWLPFVTQVCMADTGGPKNILQFTWTSQLNAKLFCGDTDSRQYFSELVDLATVHADQWQDTRVYALFKNEWGMSAVCVYTIQDIHKVFKTSPFKGAQGNRGRECVPDSTKISLDTLRMIESTSEMQDWIRPARDFGPLLFKHHSYTHIYVSDLQHSRNNQHPVLFLSLSNGAIHKVINHKNQTFVIAEYQPFNQKTHVLSIILHPSSRKLYVNSKRELVQLDVANCGQYGDGCESCVLARDPYCGWNGTHCTPETQGTMQDLARGNHAICTSLPNNELPAKAFRYSAYRHTDKNMDIIGVPSHSRYFLQCPVSSHHAQYTWYHPKNSTSCNPRERQCLLLIDSMGPEQEGEYTCKSEEMGYQRVVAKYELQLRARSAGHSLSPVAWVCLMAVLIKNLSSE
uniref:semaphorin-7A-like n=1 Tax=Scatophagus argus TaxID=75038 RepID=UPI001ED84F47|nr:semaphorin-7A-like [Scatophagus argus]